MTWRSTSLNGSAVDRSQQADGNVYPRGLTASSRHAAVTAGETALYGCVAEWKRQQGYAVQESATHSNLLGFKQPPRTGIKLVAYCLHHAGFKSPPHPQKRPFVGVVALSTNKVQPSAATASVWQHAAFGKGQLRAAVPRPFDSVTPHHRENRVTKVFVERRAFSRCKSFSLPENANAWQIRMKSLEKPN